MPPFFSGTQVLKRCVTSNFKTLLSVDHVLVIPTQLYILKVLYNGVLSFLFRKLPLSKMTPILMNSMNWIMKQPLRNSLNCREVILGDVVLKLDRRSVELLALNLKSVLL